MKKLIRSLFVSVVLATVFLVDSLPKIEGRHLAVAQEVNAGQIKGRSGGPVDSKGCGFIAAAPNYVIDLDERMDYMRISVQTDGGEPTLLVKGPGSNDRFCALADEVSGFNAELSGVWMPGKYSIYVGDRTGAQYPFTLNISTQM